MLSTLRAHVSLKKRWSSSCHTVTASSTCIFLQDCGRGPARVHHFQEADLGLCSVYKETGLCDYCEPDPLSPARKRGSRK